MRNNSGIKSATGLTGSGARDWVLQRISAVVLAVYSVVLVGFFLFNRVDYTAWHSFMTSLPMKLFSILAIISLVAHAWVGMWTVLTDYVKSSGLRLLLQSLIILAIVVYLFWGVMIFWG